VTQAYLPGVTRIANSLYAGLVGPGVASAGLPSGY